MDPLALRLLFNDMVMIPSMKPHVDPAAGFNINPKRFGVYIQSKACLDSRQWDNSDKDNSWDFSMPQTQSLHENFSRSSCCCSYNAYTAYNSPAQEIASRYRAGTSLAEATIRSSSPVSDVTDDDTWDTGSLDETASNYSIGSVSHELKAHYRHSRFEALQDVQAEAIAILQTCGEEEPTHLVCQRPGCQDTVQNVKALMYHLHIHNISDRHAFCSKCKCNYEATPGIAHECSPKAKTKSTPSSPLRDTFKRALVRLSLRQPK